MNSVSKIDKSDLESVNDYLIKFDTYVQQTTKNITIYENFLKNRQIKK